MGDSRVLKLNAANLVVNGELNPNWKGGLIDKICEVCQSPYKVKRTHSDSKYCSLKCVGLSQRKSRPINEDKFINLNCLICDSTFKVYKSQSHRYKCCSKSCSFKLRSIETKSENNPAWKEGISRLPYPYDWASISLKIRTRDGGICMNPNCCSTGLGSKKIDAHHIDYNKSNVLETNLISVCTVCNSKANFKRSYWSEFYTKILKDRYPYLF